MISILALTALITVLSPATHGFSANENGPWEYATPPTLLALPICEKGEIHIIQCETFKIQLFKAINPSVIIK